MAFELYKTGQGYWTRVVTAIGAGVLVAAGVYWLVNDVIGTWQIPGRLYVQAGVAVAVIAVFGWIVYRYVGTNPRSCDFLIATEGEMKKVNWPSRREVVGATWIVICCVFLLAVLLFLADLLFASFFRYINVLQV